MKTPGFEPDSPACVLDTSSGGRGRIRTCAARKHRLRLSKPTHCHSGNLPCFGGRGETRTHTPFRAFGFQDRCRYADSANSSVVWWIALVSNQASRSNCFTGSPASLAEYRSSQFSFHFVAQRQPCAPLSHFLSPLCYKLIQAALESFLAQSQITLESFLPFSDRSRFRLARSVGCTTSSEAALSRWPEVLYSHPATVHYLDIQHGARASRLTVLRTDAIACLVAFPLGDFLQSATDTVPVNARCVAIFVHHANSSSQSQYEVRQ
jgi:hypothetical protein